MATISPDAVAERLERDAPEMLLLDIRHADAFEEWHIPGSKHVDVFDEVKADPEAAAETLEQLPQDREIVTVCRAGERSATATRILRELGYDAKTLADGLRGWGRVHRTGALDVAGGKVIQVARPGTGCLSYVLVSEGEAIVVDPSRYEAVYDDVLADRGATLTAVLETHAHADHLSGARDLADANDVPYYLHPADSGAPGRTSDLEDGQRISVGAVRLRVSHTPGHTTGSVTFDVQGEALLTGDTLFLESVGRPDLDGGDETAIRDRATTLYRSLQRLLDRPADAVVLPAHDPGAPFPLTTATLGAVERQNALLQRDRATFVDSITEDTPETPPNHERIKRTNVGTATVTDENARQLELGPNQCAAE